MRANVGQIEEVVGSLDHVTYSTPLCGPGDESACDFSNIELEGKVFIRNPLEADSKRTKEMEMPIKAMSVVW